MESSFWDQREGEVHFRANMSAFRTFAEWDNLQDCSEAQFGEGASQPMIKHVLCLTLFFLNPGVPELVTRTMQKGRRGGSWRGGDN